MKEITVKKEQWRHQDWRKEERAEENDKEEKPHNARARILSLSLYLSFSSSLAIQSSGKHHCIEGRTLNSQMSLCFIWYNVYLGLKSLCDYSTCRFKAWWLLWHDEKLNWIPLSDVWSYWILEVRQLFIDLSTVESDYVSSSDCSAEVNGLELYYKNLAFGKITMWSPIKIIELFGSHRWKGAELYTSLTRWYTMAFCQGACCLWRYHWKRVQRYSSAAYLMGHIILTYPPAAVYTLVVILSLINKKFDLDAVVAANEEFIVENPTLAKKVGSYRNAVADFRRV